MKQTTKDEVTDVPEGPYLRKFIYPAKELFDKPDTAKLKNEKSLKQAGEFLERNSFGLAVVAAYTGVKGDKHENLVLTQARAMVVRQYLADHFKLDDSRLRTKGWGEDEQAEVGKASRVEITVYPEGSGRGPGKNKQ